VRVSRTKVLTSVLCIFCLQEQLPSEEDVFPLAICGGFITDRVCVKCNSTLGAKADAPLSNHPRIVQRRSQLKLSGQSGVAPDPFFHLLKRGRASLASDAARNISISRDRDTGLAQIRISTKKELLTTGDVEIQIDATDPDAAKREVEKIVRRHLKRTSTTAVTAEQIDRVVEDAWAKRQLVTIEHPEVIHSIPFDPNSSQRGVAKIAYELAAIWLGDEYVRNDSTAATLRNFVLGTTDAAELRGSISMGPSTNRLLEWWAAEKDCHIAISSWVEDAILITLKIFDVIEAALVVSTEPARHLTGLVDRERIRFLHLNPVTKEKRDTSLIDEMGRLARSMLASA
jgi:hypothetical protein